MSDTTIAGLGAISTPATDTLVPVQRNGASIAEKMTLAQAAPIIVSSTGGYTAAVSGATARTISDKLGEVVSVKDFGAKGDGVTNDTAAINTAIAAVIAAGRSTLVFPPGVYWVQNSGNPSYAADGSRVALLVYGATSPLRLVGYGATLLFDGASRSTYAKTIRVEACTAPVEIEGFTYDYNRLPWVQGTCTAVGASNATFTLTSAPSFSDVQRLTQHDPVSKLWLKTVLERPTNPWAAGRALTLVSGLSYRVDFSADLSALAGMVIGGTYSLVHHVYACDAVSAFSCTSVILRNNRILTAAGMGYLAENVSRVVATDNFIEAPLESTRLNSTMADGLHSINARTLVEYRGNRIRLTGDDAINSNQMLATVYQTNTTTSFYISMAAPFTPPSVGDALFAQSAAGAVVSLGTVTAVSVGTGPGGSTAITVGTTLPGGFAVGWYVWSAQMAPPTVIQNNILDSLRGNGILARSNDLTISGNVCRNLWGAAITPVTYFLSTQEGPPVYRCHITGNQAYNVQRYADAQPAAIWVQGTGLGSGTTAPAGNVREVVISGNAIFGCPNAGIVALSVDGLSITGNILCATNTAPSGNTGGGWDYKTNAIGMADCTDAVIGHNSYINGVSSIATGGVTTNLVVGWNLNLPYQSASSPDQSTVRITPLNILALKPAAAGAYVEIQDGSGARKAYAADAGFTFVNNYALRWIDGSGTEQPILSVTPANITYLRPASSAAYTEVQSYAGASRLRVDNDVTNPVLLYANGVLGRVTVGATDSGGTGFRLLRVPN